MPRGSLLEKNKAKEFFFHCLTLASPLARVIVLGIAIAFFAFIDLHSFHLPNLCLWEKLFGYCPANGTTRALNAFFHGEWKKAIDYNINVILTFPLIITIIIQDLIKLKKTAKK